MYRYFLLYKPYGVLSQFSEEGGHPGLGSVYDFPKHVYPVGRLDRDSEGLLLLTDDTSINALLLHPRNGHIRTYYVQVEGDIDESALQRLRSGVDIQIDGMPFRTAPANVVRVQEPALPERIPPIRYRKSVPDSWISLSLTEGKNRQVRKMTAAVGFPTLRLVRWSIGTLTMEDPFPGKVISLSRDELFR
jgi:23S rRNA pseudouridine2457 synthase